MEKRGSPMAEDYVTFVWKAYEWPDCIPTTGELAQRLGVNASTVSGNLHRLAADGLIYYKPYGVITLTDAGEEIARRAVYRHRVLETYLATALGLDWSEVDEEADLLEHAVSDKLIDQMDRVLGRPYADPHGDVIPRGGPHQPPVPATLLVDAEEATSVRVLRVADTDRQALIYLSEVGISVGTTLFVEAISATAEVVTVTRGTDIKHQLPWQVAVTIRVIPC